MIAPSRRSSWTEATSPILTRQSTIHLLIWPTIAPITSTIRGITSEVPVGPRNGLDHESVVSDAFELFVT